MQPQNIVINQVPLSHAIMTNVNANNGIPVVNAVTHVNSTDQSGEIKGSLTIMDTVGGGYHGLC